jgi:uncharacterized membrane protein required for colicin V production
MALDLALGLIILVAAFRGWFQGFVTQAVRIGGLIACVYLADPVRDFAKPRVLPYLPTIQPELVDRLLWWVSAVFAYVVLVGCATLLVKMTRRPEIPGIPPSNRNDQFAGFFVGATKGVLVAALVTAGVQKYGMNEIKTVTWADEQAKASWALKWNEQFQPVAKLWSSRPVRHLVNHIHRMGLQNPAGPAHLPEEEKDEPSAALQTARRERETDPSRVDETGTEPRSSARSPSSDSPGDANALAPEVEKEVEEIKTQLTRRGEGSN